MSVGIFFGVGVLKIYLGKEENRLVQPRITPATFFKKEYAFAS